MSAKVFVCLLPLSAVLKVRMRSQDTGTSADICHAQASRPSRYSRPAHKQRRHRDSQPQCRACQSTIVNGIVLCPLIQLPGFDFRYIRRRQDVRKRRMIIPVQRCSSHACPNSKSCRSPYEHRWPRYRPLRGHTLCISRGEGRIRGGKDGRGDDGVLRCRVRTDGIRPFGSKAMLPFAYTILLATASPHHIL